jgi:hypothetical protein
MKEGVHESVFVCLCFAAVSYGVVDGVNLSGWCL